MELKKLYDLKIKYENQIDECERIINYGVYSSQPDIIISAKINELKYLIHLINREIMRVENNYTKQ